MKTSLVSDLSGFYAVRWIKNTSVLRVVLFFAGWIQTVLIVADSYPEVAVSNPVRPLAMIYGNSQFHTKIAADQIHIFYQVWGRTSKMPDSKWHVGHLQVADYCITISCVPASSDLSCFFKWLTHSSCYEPYPYPPPPRHVASLATLVLDPGCLLSHSLADHINHIQNPVVPSVPGVCVWYSRPIIICSFIYSFIQPSIRALLRLTMY